MSDVARMRVLFVTNLFPTPAEPARGMFNAQLADQLALLCDLTVVVPLPWFPDNTVGRWLAPKHARIYGGIPPLEMREGVEVYYARYPLIPGFAESIHSGAMRLGIGSLIRRLHRRRSFDVVLALWLYPDAAALGRLARSMQIPLVATALGSDVNSMMNKGVRRRAIIDTAMQAAAVVVVASQLGSKLASHGIDPGKIVAISNGVDTARFRRRDRAQCRRELTIRPDGKIIVCIARLSAEKGVAVLVQAMPAVIDRFPDVRLFVVGEGGQRAELEQLCARIGCTAAVQLVGAVAHESVPVWLGAADLCCLPSFREGHPNALMEALACGLPMVASEVGSVADYVSEKTGIIVPPGDPLALGAALTAALEREWDHESIAASVGTRTWAVVAGEYEAVLDRAATARRAAPRVK